MDYLVIEGYKSAAEEFSKEAELTSSIDFQSIEDRTNIKEALQRGDVEEACRLGVAHHGRRPASRDERGHRDFLVSRHK